MRQKDSDEVIRFRVSFNKLRELTKDDPAKLEKLVAEDRSIIDLCWDIHVLDVYFTSSEKKRRRMFAESVDPKFIAAWRSYERDFAKPITDVIFADLGWDFGDVPPSKKSETDRLWEFADDRAKSRAGAIEVALDYACQSRNFGDEFDETLKDAEDAWRSLHEEVGFELRAVFRRRELIPFVNIPRHVAGHYGSGEKLSLFTNLSQAHDAFVLGVPFAALALMRSVLEIVLREHYSAVGKDLEERIKNAAARLPKGVPAGRLHALRKLANDVLHLNIESSRLPINEEKELLSYFLVLRALIEGAPSIPR